MAAREHHRADFHIASNLKTGLYARFWTDDREPGLAGAECVRMVTLSQDRGGSYECRPDYGFDVFARLEEHQLCWFIDRRPGSIWIVGNEVAGSASLARIHNSVSSRATPFTNLPSDVILPRRWLWPGWWR